MREKNMREVIGRFGYFPTRLCVIGSFLWSPEKEGGEQPEEESLNCEAAPAKNTVQSM